MLRNRHPRRRQSGLSLVELMVGIAVGLFVVAAASTLVATQLVDNRRLLLEVQVQQDLRAAADIISRDLRRAGSWGNADAAMAGVAVGTTGGDVNQTPSGLVFGGTESLTYHSSRAAGTTGPYGFRLSGAVLQSQLAAAGWQALTDDSTMRVTSFSIVPADEPPVRAVCSRPCPVPIPTGQPVTLPIGPPEQNCWPTLVVRKLRVDITGESTSDSAVRRSVSSFVRLRNDVVQFNDAANPTLACPA